MKRIILALFLIMIFASCRQNSKPLNEDFSAVCFLDSGDKVEVGSGVFMNPPKIHSILFVYHDSVFQVQIKNKKSSYFYLKCRKTPKDSLLSLFSIYGKTTLKEQLKNKEETNCSSSCAPECYFLFKNSKKINFGIFYYHDYSEWTRRFGQNEVKLNPNQFPSIYQTIYHTLNSKHWDYFMSNDYYYKAIRTYRHVEFTNDSNISYKAK
ncbi:hypothetical protein [Fluviicola taffensis]|uniref:Lipoprotein n=1 Tax=Fluviicola taffensis (strain DSM 16823 / NCIMB 13979 / RW262) TaxID=755732 RepID=F2IHS5_FLUTR|nr:hypothetical protein [Fluviicola taffensis]AEA44853.1 hypothetical protein Fluta_2874 [Fluviicola taffensis DSM 16823]